MADSVIQQIMNMRPVPGRFLERVDDGHYVDVPYQRVFLKVSQALRERRWFETDEEMASRKEKKQRRKSFESKAKSSGGAAAST